MEMKKFVGERKAAFFSTDALIALIIILFVVLAARPLINYVQPDSDLHSDVLTALSTLKVYELDDVSVQSMIASGEIKDPNKTLLEQIGEFYVFDYPDITRAKNLADIALREVNTTENFGVWFESGGSSTLIFSHNETPIEDSRNVLVAREIISGIQAGNATKGYSARAFLSSDWATTYYYFGGYVGDGNISLNVSYNGNISDEGVIEVAINKEFDLYINSLYYGHFNKTTGSAFEPERYVFNTTFFTPGTNLVEFRGNGLYVAGGFVKINYKGEALFLGQNKTYHFPGVNGLINVYDSFFVPSNLTSMEISLHMDTNYSIFLNIGNVTVYNGTTNGPETIFVDNSYLSSVLDYDSFNGETVPLRLGLENASYLGITQEVDVFSVSDLSGSMDDNCDNCNEYTCLPVDECRDYSDPNPFYQGCKICDTKTANDLLVNIILNKTGNRVGLVGYRTGASSADFHELSDDDVSLKGEISSWDGDGNTCICCGINKAMEGFLDAQGQSDKPGRLLVYYNFNDAVGGSVADRSGLSNDGSVSGNPTSVSGIEGNSFDLDGAGDYISVPDILESKEGTISIWVDSDDDDDRTILDASNPTEFFYIELDNGDDLGFKFEDADGTDFVDAEIDASNIENWGWTHIVGVWRYEGGTPSAALYVDGVLVDTDNDPADLMPNLLGPIIGRTLPGGSAEEDFDGSIDEFRIYSRALTLAEIMGLNDTTAVCGNGIAEVGEVCDGDSQFCESGGYEGMQDCNSGCDGFLACNTTGVCGDGLIQINEECDDGNTEDHDGCSSNCTIEDRYLSMVVMSDGQANVECSAQGWTPDLNGNGVVDDAGDDAIQASIDACNDYGVVIHSVGFGYGVDETTLIAIADNGCGGNYYYSDATNLSDVYKQIASTILTNYSEQTLYANGSSVNTVLYPDSYIKFNYDDVVAPYGLVVTAEANFDDLYGGDFYVPAGVTPVITRVVSYSGARWTTGVSINGNSIFNLTEYGGNFVALGDPYQITDANSIVTAGTNFANVTIGSAVSNQTGASSAYNKIIYTISQNASSFSDILPVAEGCIWTIQLEDGANLSNVDVPSSYSGSDECLFLNSTFDAMPGSNDYGVIVNTNDAYQVATLDLLRAIDLNDNGKIDVPFTEQDLQITLSEIEGIPFTYYTEIQVRKWT